MKRLKQTRSPWLMAAGLAILCALILGQRWLDNAALARSASLVATAAEQNTQSMAYPIQKIAPQVFRGDVRNLPYVPSKPKLELEIRGLGNFKQTLTAPAPEAPNIPLAAMP